MPTPAHIVRHSRGAAPARVFAVSLAGALLVGALAGCGGELKPRDPLAASDAPEQVLRTLRLAGVEHAVVGEERGTAIVRLQIPAVSSAADVEIAWQVAVTALAESYPRARTYAVQLFGPGAMPLVEFDAHGRDARRAIDADDAAKLRSTADVRSLFEEFPATETLRDATPTGATVLPEDAVAAGTDLSGAYLDAKNRAATLMGENASATLADATDATADAAGDAERTRLAVPGRAAPGPDEDTGVALSQRLSALLGASGDSTPMSTPPLSRFADSFQPGAEPARVLALRTLLAATAAVTAEKPFGSVISATRETARIVIAVEPPDPDSEYREGNLADAILVAAQSPGAPADAKAVTRFIHGESRDFDATTAGMTAAATSSATPLASKPPTDVAQVAARDLAVPAEVLSTVRRDAASDGGPPAVSWEATGGVRQRVAPTTWLAYLRRDGRVFWLAGEDGPVALTNASLDGWAWSARRAHVVDATDVGRILSTIELP